MSEDRQQQLRRQAASIFRQALQGGPAEVFSGVSAAARAAGPGRSFDESSFLKMLQQNDIPTQWMAIRGLAEVGTPAALEPLLPFAGDMNKDLREAATEAIRRIQERAGGLPEHTLDRMDSQGTVSVARQAPPLSPPPPPPPLPPRTARSQPPPPPMQKPAAPPPPPPPQKPKQPAAKPTAPPPAKPTKQPKPPKPQTSAQKKQEETSRQTEVGIGGPRLPAVPAMAAIPEPGPAVADMPAIPERAAIPEGAGQYQSPFHLDHA